MPSQLTLLSQDLAALSGLLTLLSDPVLLLDESLHVLQANAPAQEGLGVVVGQGLPTGPLRDWLRLAAAARLEERRAPPTPTLPLKGGGRAQWHLIDIEPGAGEAARWLLHARRSESGARAAAKAVPAAELAGPTTAADGSGWARELVQIFWSSPFPALLLDGQGRIEAGNAALADLLGREAAALRGLNFSSLMPAGERARLQAATQASKRDRTALPAEFHLLDAEGRERWMRCTQHELPQPPGQSLLVLQDGTAELAARQQAERAQAEMAQWFELSPLPMALFDEQGLLLRANSAFAALSLDAPASLHEAAPALQQLLGWSQGQVLPALREAREMLQTQAQMIDPAGRSRWLRGRLRRLDGLGSQRRYMAVLEDRSSEQERDLAHQQLDALMDTAGVGLATFQQDAGWLRPRSPKAGGGSADKPRSALAGLQGVSRDIVEPDSLPEFERLQQALKKGDRVEVRYAVRHPELGRRWLLTRVEPGELASGQRTTSVVTLDVSAQAQAERRSEQLLRELSTIMDSSGVGMAYLRGGQLLRCNGGFEQMLGLPAGTPAGTPVAQLFAALPLLAGQVQAALPGLEAGQGFEAEFMQVGSERWLALSLRHVQGPAGEAVAVISDISRLKAQQAQLERLAQDRELMFSLSDVGIAILREGRIARANEALANMTGYRIGELTGLPHRQLFESEFDFERQQQAMAQALASSGQWKGERRLRRRDGTGLWTQVSKRVMRPDAPAEDVIATYVNVDDRWRAQQSLMLQTERERAVLDSVLVGIVTVGRGGIEWMNRSARRMFGGDLAAFAGQPMSTVATPDPDHPFRHEHYLDELTEGQAETFECRLQARDGREFWVVGNAVVTGVEASGRQLTYALLDIERRRQAEAETQKAQASLQRIIEAAPLAISLHDAKTLAVEQINQAAAALAGRPETELLGASPEALFGEEQGGVIRNDMLSALMGSEVTQREYRLSLNGQLRVWDARLLHLASVLDAQGQSEPEQLLLVASDVTEQRAAEEARLAAAIAQRELLVREVHHRIKNNLQGVAGLLQQIAVRRPEVAGVIGEAVGQVQAIAQVYGLQVGVAGPLRVRKIVEAITGSVQRLHGRPIELKVEGEDGSPADLLHRWALPEAESIPIALTLNELLGNAFKHGGGASPHCTLICAEHRVALRIANPGRLPEGFQLSKVPGGVSGLGLVRALLPRRSAILSLEQEGEQVVCLLELLPPSVTLLASL